MTSVSLSAQESGDRFTKIGEFQILKVTLHQVKMKLGPSRFTASGQAGDYQASIQYQADGVYVNFFSGEMGGPQLDLLGFSISRSRRGNAKVKISTSRLPLQTNIAGIHLGMSRNEFTNLLGVKVDWLGDKASSVFKWQQPYTPVEQKRLDPSNSAPDRHFFYMEVWVEGTFSQDNLVAFSVWKSEEPA